MAQQTTVIPINRELAQKDQRLNFLQQDPKSFCSGLVPKTYDDCISSVTPALSGIRRHFGEQVGGLVIRGLLNVLVADLVLFFNVGKNMGAEQVKSTVQLIIEDYWMLKPEDFKLCFNNMKKGVYGKAYDRMDGQVILQALATYVEGRTVHVMDKNEQKHRALTRDEVNSRGLRLERYTEENHEYAKVLTDHIKVNHRNENS